MTRKLCISCIYYSFLLRSNIPVFSFVSQKRPSLANANARYAQLTWFCFCFPLFHFSGISLARSLKLLPLFRSLFKSLPLLSLSLSVLHFLCHRHECFAMLRDSGQRFNLLLNLIKICLEFGVYLFCFVRRIWNWNFRYEPAPILYLCVSAHTHTHTLFFTSISSNALCACEHIWRLCGPKVEFIFNSFPIFFLACFASLSDPISNVHVCVCECVCHEWLCEFSEREEERAREREKALQIYSVGISQNVYIYIYVRYKVTKFW